jgi:hypothetical protein
MRIMRCSDHRGLWIQCSGPDRRPAQLRWRGGMEGGWLDFVLCDESLRERAISAVLL